MFEVDDAPDPLHPPGPLPSSAPAQAETAGCQVSLITACWAFVEKATTAPADSERTEAVPQPSQQQRGRCDGSDGAAPRAGSQEYP